MVTAEIAESFGMKEASGALVAEVSQDGPAKKAGIKPGDIILDFNGQKVETMRRLPRIVAETPIGIDVPVILWRGGKEVKVLARIGELKEEIASEKSSAKPNEKKNSSDVVKLDGLGLALSEANQRLRKKFSIEKDVEGAIVVGAVPDGIASQMGVRIGDVIVEVDQNTITGPSEVVTIIGNVLKKGKKKSVLFTINRQGSIRFIGLKLK